MPRPRQMPRRRTTLGRGDISLGVRVAVQGRKQGDGIKMALQIALRRRM
jgi:hypothetical protein